jgi:hypothetical protein
MVDIQVSTEYDNVQQLCMFASQLYKLACVEYILVLIITSTVVLYGT